jgi:ankyrin repeat protein
VNGDTAFLIALMHGHVDAARVLAEAGASVTARRADGSSALHVAASVSPSPSPSSPSPSPSSASPSPSSASSRPQGGNLRMFAALLESGACSTLLGAKNANGDNVYHVIAREKNLQLLLLAASSTKDAIHVIAANAKGQSPLAVALESPGGDDGNAVAFELVNTSGAFATGAINP